MTVPVNAVNRLEAACRALEKRLAAAQCEGFAGLAENVRRAVLESERLVHVLDEMAAAGLKPRGAEGEPVTTDTVKETVRALRASVAVLAATTPEMLSSHYLKYVERARATMELALEVRRCGLARPPSRGDEWNPFREFSPWASNRLP